MARGFGEEFILIVAEVRQMVPISAGKVSAAGARLQQRAAIAELVMRAGIAEVGGGGAGEQAGGRITEHGRRVAVAGYVVGVFRSRVGGSRGLALHRINELAEAIAELEAVEGVGTAAVVVGEGVVVADVGVGAAGIIVKVDMGKFREHRHRRFDRIGHGIGADAELAAGLRRNVVAGVDGYRKVAAKIKAGFEHLGGQGVSQGDDFATRAEANSWVAGRKSLVARSYRAARRVVIIDGVGGAVARAQGVATELDDEIVEVDGAFLDRGGEGEEVFEGRQVGLADGGVGADLVEEGEYIEVRGVVAASQATGDAIGDAEVLLFEHEGVVIDRVVGVGVGVVDSHGVGREVFDALRQHFKMELFGYQRIKISAEESQAEREHRSGAAVGADGVARAAVETIAGFSTIAIAEQGREVVGVRGPGVAADRALDHRQAKIAGAQRLHFFAEGYLVDYAGILIDDGAVAEAGGADIGDARRFEIGDVLVLKAAIDQRAGVERVTRLVAEGAGDAGIDSQGEGEIRVLAEVLGAIATTIGVVINYILDALDLDVHSGRGVGARGVDRIEDFDAVVVGS